MGRQGGKIINGLKGQICCDLSEVECITSGHYALEIIQRQTRRLGKLQPEVLADQDPESLHQFRVGVRRLRTVLQQFAPALLLPNSVTPGRLADVARHTSLTRDLDVLGLRLENHLIPGLSEQESRAMEPVLRRLRRERAQAFEELQAALRSTRYLKLLARLHKWQRQPLFTPLGGRSIKAWVVDWLTPSVGDLFLHQGWLVDQPDALDLHDLRKKIKAARYALEHLEPLLQPELRARISDLKQAQEKLGELQDLQVLLQLLDRGSFRKDRANLPGLIDRLNQEMVEAWRLWQQLAESMLNDDYRQAFHRHLAAAPT
ncbi:MAG: CHAD domain-containing protein [Cyanobacteriota bacterium]|jgi:CHAD domain-containing protein